MNTSELVKALADKRDLTQAETRRLLDIIIKTIKENLAADNPFTIPDLGTFRTKKRKGRKSYNPHYEQYMKIPPKQVVDFTPNQKLKESLKQVESDHE